MVKVWLRDRLRDWLGLDEDRKALDDYAEAMEDLIVELKGLIDAQTKGMRIQTQALGRIIAKIDPMFGVPEVPGAPGYDKRKLESDRLGALAIDRIVAEDQARRRSIGE